MLVAPNKHKIMKSSTFASSISKLSVEETLNYITDMLLTSYVCGQLGYYHELTETQEEIYCKVADNLANKLGFTVSDKYNDPTFVWIRQNPENYSWIYKVWKTLSKNYFEYNGQVHDSFQHAMYMDSKKIFKEGA